MPGAPTDSLFPVCPLPKVPDLAPKEENPTPVGLWKRFAIQQRLAYRGAQQGIWRQSRINGIIREIHGHREELL